MVLENDFQPATYRVSQLMSASISISIWADNTHVWHFIAIRYDSFLYILLLVFPNVPQLRTSIGI